MSMAPRTIATDRERCNACVACMRVCPTRAIRTRGGEATVDASRCIECGACVEACPRDALRAVTSSPADLERFKLKVAIPSLTLYGQFGPDVRPGQVLHALRQIGFDRAYDLSWMCEMVGSATDAYLSECQGPWPKISTTCPAVVRLIQIRYPEMVSHLLPLETPRELAAKLHRRRLASELGLDPSEIGIFFITQCAAIMNSIVAPVGLERSNLDGAMAISELYGPLRKALREHPGSESDDAVSPRGLGWAMGAGEVASMRNNATIRIRGVHEVTEVFDRIEDGVFQNIDFIEAYICTGGCLGGHLTIAPRHVAQRSLDRIARQLGEGQGVKEEKVRSLLREHFFDLHGEIAARPVQPLAGGLRQAVAVKREKDRLVCALPGKDCGACGAPDCATLADDVVRGQATIDDCVFIRLEALQRRREACQEGEP
ncbi:MAG TPA: [Fe-Fe] hydrogenase large subunit C-terminal domain-containing protein [Thermoanaerobaculaceae bacterium]|nr:[Fe-Fe] hydrogenase large subunit C-terminal domain-containing protein [Thermoanaerobaculaceae bacterium]HRS17098.1 [Fe-Fe] hydrogenase large subunit C-terminal domain-containing protein [Thermoanaerobaculaceae bacterium]